MALLAGAVALFAILRASRATKTPQKVAQANVVVASRAIAVRELIQAGDIELRTGPADMVPESAFRDVDEVVGLLSLIRLSPGEMILSSHVVSPTIKGGPVAFTMDKNKVAMAFPAEDLTSRNNLLQPGDRVDVLFSIEVKVQDEEETMTFDALQNLEIAAIVESRNLEARAQVEAGAGLPSPLAIVFALDPQDALVLKHLKDIGGNVDIVLRAPDAKERFSTQPVHRNYLIDRYQLRIPVLP